MGWLIGPAIAAAMCAGLAVFLYDHVLVATFRGLNNGVARAGLFIGSFAFVAAYSLLRSFDDRTRWLRRSKEVRRTALPKLKRFW